MMVVMNPLLIELIDMSNNDKRKDAYMMIYSKVENEIREQLINAYHTKGLMTFTQANTILVDNKIEILENLVNVICEERDITAKEFLVFIDSND